MFTKRLEAIFLGMILLATALLLYNFYNSYSFKNNPLPQNYIKQIHAKEQDILKHMQQNFGYSYKFPIIITDKIPGRLYGLTTYRGGAITIYLNKKVMQESFKYILESVIAHEYAHALLFELGHNSNKNEGHSKEWKETCVKLGGKDCRQYVNQHEIIMSKLPFQ